MTHFRDIDEIFRRSRSPTRLTAVNYADSKGVDFIIKNMFDVTCGMNSRKDKRLSKPLRREILVYVYDAGVRVFPRYDIAGETLLVCTSKINPCY
jgi:hypothetical protein